MHLVTCTTSQVQLFLRSICRVLALRTAASAAAAGLLADLAQEVCRCCCSQVRLCWLLVMVDLVRSQSETDQECLHKASLYNSRSTAKDERAMPCQLPSISGRMSAVSIIWQQELQQLQ